MDYTVFIPDTLANLGLECYLVANAFQDRSDTQWNLRLPAIEFKRNTVLVMNFQDWMSWDNQYLELETVAQHYGPCANQVLVTTLHHAPEQHYTGPVQIVEFSSHNIREAQRLQQHDTAWALAPKTRAWQCLNGRETPYRWRAANLLRTWSGGYLSLGMSIPLPDWPYSTYRGGTENDDNFQRLRGIYGTAAVNIVTETQYDYPCLVSEKTLLAFAACQIPIVIGYQGIVRDCETMGFDMFTDVVDTSYDHLPNDIRVEQAILRNQALIQGNLLLSDLDSRLLANRQRVLGSGLVDYYRQNFIRKAEQIAQRLVLC